jgi:hypothetical protein
VTTTTPVPSTPSTRTPTRTEGFTPDVPTDTPEPTRTPDIGHFATTTTDAPSGTFQLQVDVPSDDLVSFPVEGVVQVFGETFGFTRRRTSRVLNLKDPDGLPFAITAGTVVLVIEATPGPVRPGPVVVRNEQGGSGCAIQAAAPYDASLVSLALGVVGLVAARRLRRCR